MNEKNAKQNSGMKKIVLRLTGGLILCLGVIFLLFYGLTQQYRHNSAFSSAFHLIEINRQGKTNIESFLLKDKSAALSLAREMETGSVSTEEELVSAMKFFMETWNEDDIYVYTQRGQCFNSERVVQNNGEASRIASETVQKGESFNIVKSQIEYAVAVNTKLQFQGSGIAAISVVHNLDTLIEDIGLRSFDGRGEIYLTRQNGVTVCHSQSESAKFRYNLLSVLTQGSLQELKGSGMTIEESMAAGQEDAFLYDTKNGEPRYVVLTPVHFMGETLYLFNLVPQQAVNQTMDEYTRNISLLSGAVIFLTVFLFALFFLLYYRRSRRFDADLESRERLFDLLVSETHNAFMLLYEGNKKPAYISSNLKRLLQKEDLLIRECGGKYCLSGNIIDSNDKSISQINAALSSWNGEKEFDSGYLPYEIDHEERYFRLSLHPAFSQKGEFVGIVQDLTPEYHREESLREALKLADSANRAKTQFLSSISHDIRTPLNAIINMTRFLQESPDDREETVRDLAVIRQSSEHLLCLINDVLDMSRIESGKLSFANAEFRMETVLNEVCGIIRPLCGAKSLHFFSEPVLIRHSCLVGDALRLNQILINILNNAVKFTPPDGTVRLEVTELAAIKSEEIPFRFTIKDTGMGIPPDKVNSIFEPFSRVENEIVHETEGTGLGLAITKRFVDALGGTIKVESTLGQGSTFTVELIYKVSDTRPADAEVRNGLPAARRFDGMRALLAEDNEINTIIAVRILSEWGFAVESAKDGREALHLFLSHPEGYYSIVYMDIQMPEMNGYEASLAIRQSGRKDASTVPIVAMTANAFAEDVERARVVGMNAHIAKPLNLEELNRITGKLIRDGE